MKTRIKELISREKLNSAQFSTEIGIAPSSLHHIVSGRNNPSLDVIQKILERYPQINAEWLINGKGPVFKNMVQGELFKSPEESIEMERKDVVPETKSPVISTTETEIQQKEPIKKIDKIVIFYTDNTFKVYIP